jgi:hypothetical protein
MSGARTFSLKYFAGDLSTLVVAARFDLAAMVCPVPQRPVWFPASGGRRRTKNVPPGQPKAAQDVRFCVPWQLAGALSPQVTRPSSKTISCNFPDT